MPEPITVRVTVNGKRFEQTCEPRKLLVDFLREDLGLTGTHVGCEHGVCGACTILFNGEAVRSCIMLALDFLRLNPSPTDQEIREAISAVLCRCTGYRDIVRSIAAAAGKMRTARTR